MRRSERSVFPPVPEAAPVTKGARQPAVALKYLTAFTPFQNICFIHRQQLRLSNLPIHHPPRTTLELMNEAILRACGTAENLADILKMAKRTESHKRTARSIDQRMRARIADTTSVGMYRYRGFMPVGHLRRGIPTCPPYPQCSSYPKCSSCPSCSSCSSCPTCSSCPCRRVPRAHPPALLI